MVELHRLWSLGGWSFWQQLSGKMTRTRQQSLLISTLRAVTVVRIFFNRHPPNEQSALADAIMGMYQVDASPENVDLEDDEEEERMSAWVNSLTI